MSEEQATFKNMPPELAKQIQERAADMGDYNPEAFMQPREKLPMHSGCLGLFPLALEEIARLSHLGNTKHGSNGGPISLADKSGGINAYREALARHVIEGASDVDNPTDGEGVTHIAQAAWNALAVLQLFLEGRETLE